MLYNKESSLGQASVKLLAELYYLAVKYPTVEMQELITQEVASRKMNVGKLIKAAKVVVSCSSHMEKFCESIIKISSAFVKKRHSSVLEIFQS